MLAILSIKEREHKFVPYFLLERWPENCLAVGQVLFDERTSAFSKTMISGEIVALRYPPGFPQEGGNMENKMFSGGLPPGRLTRLILTRLASHIFF